MMPVESHFTLFAIMREVWLDKANLSMYSL